MDLTLLIAAKLLFGWLLADLIGGVVHWMEDRVVCDDTPGLRSVIAANRLHHSHPLAFLAGSMIARNGSTWLAAGAVSLAWLLLFGGSIVWAAATVGGLVSSEVHRLAHTPRPASLLLRILQDVGLIQSCAHHAGHHRPGAARRYCVLTDLLNPLLDGLSIWARIEGCLRRLGFKLAADEQAIGQ